MAENVLGGGNLYTAKPFHVINPSGMSTGESVGTIASVGEGNRQRALQASEGAKNRASNRESDMRNDKLQRDRMAQEASIAEKQLAQNQAIENRRIALEEQRAAEERQERERANRIAELQMQRQIRRDKTLRMNLKEDKGIPVTPGERGDTDGDGYLSPQEQAVRLRANQQETRNLETQSKKMLLAKGLLDQSMVGSLGRIIEDADSLQTARFEVFRRAAEQLPSILAEMETQELPLPAVRDGRPETMPHSGPSKLTHTPYENKEELPDFALSDQDRERVEGLKKMREGVERVRLENEAKAKRGVLKVDSLASHLAMTAHGKMAVEQVETHVNTLLSALDGFAQGDKTQEQVAAMAYKALQEGGADTDYLSDLLARTMVQAGTMKKGAARLGAESQAGEKPDKVAAESAEGHTERALRIANMARALSQVKDKEGNLIVPDFGDGGGMYDVYADDYKDGRGGAQKMADTVREVYGALIRSDNPAVIIASLRDADLTNDPEIGKVISSMDPHLKKQIIDSAERELARMQRDMAGAGLTGNAGMYLDHNSLADLEKREALEAELADLETLGAEQEARLQNQRDAEFDLADEEYLKALRGL